MTVTSDTPQAIWPVLVPSPTTPVGAWIRPHSGIVGQPMKGSEAGRLVIDYEGNRHEASNIITWADRVEHAAGRAATQYPTIARAFVERHEMIEVGTYATEDGRITIHEQHEALVREWLGPEADLAAECLTTSGRAQRRRELLAAQAQMPTGHPMRARIARELQRLAPTPPQTSSAPRRY